MILSHPCSPTKKEKKRKEKKRRKKRKRKKKVLEDFRVGIRDRCFRVMELDKGM